MTAKLAGLRYCPEAAIAAAAANSGVAEAASPSCPADSLVGSAAIVTGSGPEPLHIDSGKAFLAGPYHGAPLSLAVITPATAGPFDLGTVVVRVALFVDPKTAQVKTVTDPLPHVYGGTLLDLRSVSVKIDRQGFSLNGTNCTASAFAATLRGGGSNPNDPAAFSSVAASSPYQASGCDALPLRAEAVPADLRRRRSATKNPKLRAILVARPGDANIAPRRGDPAEVGASSTRRASRKVCTRVQFAAGQCPSNSVYGFAEANSPLLDGPLKGPVYLRSSDNTLPDLVAALHGQVDVELAGRTDTRQRPDPQHLRHGPRRAGLALRADDQGRQEEGPAGQLTRPLRPQAVREARPDGAERQEGDEEEAEGAHALQEEEQARRRQGQPLGD